MNSRSANSGGSASLVRPPPPIEVFVVLPDGSCIPATPDKLRIVLRQARSEVTKQARLKALEKAAELQCNLEDRAAARRLLQELAEIDIERRRIAATLRARVKPDRPARQTSDVVKRVPNLPSRRAIAMTQVPSSWVVDDFGMRGVHYSQSYIGRKSPGFYRGAARDRWQYEARDEAVLRDAFGEPIIIANLGEDVDEIGAAWQAIEDATTRENGKIQIRIIVALDADASQAENIAALEHFCKNVLDPLGLPYSAVIHRAPSDGDQRNVHAHILTNFRPTARVEPYCWSFADHVRGELDGKNGVQMLRHLWAHSMSEAAGQAQRNMLYTGLGYGARGLDLEAGVHLGEALSAISKRGGKVCAEERNRVKRARNVARRVIRDADKKLAALTALRDSLIAQAEAERAGAMPVRRLVSMNNDRRSSRSILLKPSRASDPQPPCLHVAVGRDLRQPGPFVASRHYQRPLPIQRSTGIHALSAHLTPSLPAESEVPLVRSAEPVARTTLVTASAPPHKPRLSSVYPQPALFTPLAVAVPVVRTPVAKAKTVRHWRPADRLTSTVAGPSSEPKVRMGDDLLAAFARWREVQTQGVAIEQSDTLPKAKARPRSVGRDERREPHATTHIVTPVSAGAYRRRRAMAKSARMPEPADTLATREWLENNPRVSFGEDAALQLKQSDYLIAWLRKVDAYIADFGSGPLELDPQVMAKLKIDDDRLQRAHVQRELTAIRHEQQAVLSELCRQATERPLAFSKTANRFWPSDLDPALLRRIDRWHAGGSEGLSRDLFPIEQAIREAHRRDQTAKAGSVSGGSAMGDADLPAAGQIGDEAGLRPAARVDALAYLRIPAFRPSGKPTQSLTLLLRHAAENPDDIAVVAGQPPRVSARTPDLIENLLDQWRDNDRVLNAVAETIARSRAAGRPEWPAEFASALRVPNNSPATPKWKPRAADRSR